MNMLVDLGQGAISGATFAPVGVTQSGGGAGIDLINGIVDTNMVLNVGNVPGGQTVTPKAQESDDNITWSDVVGGAGTVIVGTGANARQFIRFQRTKRYVRGFVALGGASSTTVAMDIFAQARRTGATLGGVDRSPSSSV